MSNMYDFVEDNINPVKGKCGYSCLYCYVKRFNQKQNSIHFVKEELSKKTESDKIYFVCSGCDLFHPDVPFQMINATIKATGRKNGLFLYHTKNPWGMYNELKSFADNSILCITFETDNYQFSNNKLYSEFSQAPSLVERYNGIRAIKKINKLPYKLPLWLTIEPIMKFSEHFIKTLFLIRPDQINIGADSGNNNLPEPEPDEIRELIDGLQTAGIKVHLKKNLNRLLEARK